MATHSSTLAWKIPWATIHGVAKNWTQLSDFTFTFSQYVDVCVCAHAVIQIYCIALIQIEKGNIFFLFLVINSTFVLLIKIVASLIFQSSVNTSHHIFVLENST